MAGESAWRDRFLRKCKEHAEQRGELFTWLVLNVSMQRGVPDTWIHWAHKPQDLGPIERASAMLEFKKGKGVVSAAQRVRMVGFEALGVKTCVVRLLNNDEALLEYVDEIKGGYIMVPFGVRASWESWIERLFYWLQEA